MKAAIVGCGRIGAVHAAAVRLASPDARLVFCDVDGERARGAAGGAAAYDDLQTCLDTERPEVVHVCTPPEAHAADAVTALRAGASVLVEKPMALDRRGADAIGEILRARPGALCVDHNFLFEPCVRSARTWVGEGRIGRLLAADVFYGVDPLPGDAGPGGWAHRLPGGRFTDVLPHALYLVRAFVGDVERITACAVAAREHTSELGIVLGCAQGLGSVRVSLASAPWELSLVLRGADGTVRVDLARQRAVLAARPTARNRHAAQLQLATATSAQTVLGAVERVAGKATGRLRGYPGMRALIAAFHDTMRDGAPPPVPFADGAAVAGALEDVRAHLAWAAQEEAG